MPFNPEKLAKLVGKTGGPATVRTGGKGTVRRKHKAVRKAATHDDKRLKATLNKLAVRDIPAIEEVNLFRDDGMVVHFVNPKGDKQRRPPTTSHCSAYPSLRLTFLCACVISEFPRNTHPTHQAKVVRVARRPCGQAASSSRLRSRSRTRGQGEHASSASSTWSVSYFHYTVLSGPCPAHRALPTLQPALRGYTPLATAPVAHPQSPCSPVRLLRPAGVRRGAASTPRGRRRRRRVVLAVWLADGSWEGQPATQRTCERC